MVYKQLYFEIREQFQLGKLVVAHSLKLTQGAVGQLPQLGFLRRKLTTHLGQSLNQLRACCFI